MRESAQRHSSPTQSAPVLQRNLRTERAKLVRHSDLLTGINVILVVRDLEIFDGRGGRKHGFDRVAPVEERADVELAGAYNERPDE